MRAKVQTNSQAKALSEEEAATLLSHVRELQIRLLITAAVLLTAGVVAYLNYPLIIEILRKPLNAPLIISSVSGSFSFVMKICLVAGIAVSVPLIVYNFIMFVRPAFQQVFTRKRVFMMTAGSVAAAAGGTLFGYFFIIPGAIHFFSGFHVSGVTSMIQADGYLNFVVNVLVTFTLMFQLPIIVSLIDRIKAIPPRAMWKGEKWALVGSILISLVVPFAMDIMTQVLIAAPIFLLYNISFVVVVLQHKYADSVVKKTVKVEAKVARKAEKAISNERPARTAHSVAPALAVQSLQPHPQLAEVFALQASGQTTTKPVAAHAVTKVAPIAKPVMKPIRQFDIQPSAHKPMAAKPVKHTAMPPSIKPVAKVTKPVVPAAIKPAAPVLKPAPIVAPAPIITVAPAPVLAPLESMDGMMQVNRAQPTYVIRQATALKAPARSGSLAPARSLSLMTDIR